MKKLLIALLLFSGSAFAGGSSPGLYYGFTPTAAQWNSYFANKLDYTPGTVNQMGYWDGSGNFLNAAVSGDCTSVANVFSCAHVGSVLAGPGAFTSLSNSGGYTQTGTAQNNFNDITAVDATTSPSQRTIIYGNAGGFVPSATAEGSGFAWNVSGGEGDTSIINFPNGLIGGFNFYTWTGSIFNQVVSISSAGVINSAGYNLNSKVLFSSTAPTIASGFGTSPSIVNSNGTASFSVNVGTGGTATSGVITLPAATTNWNCAVVNPLSGAGTLTQQSAHTATSVTLTNYTISTDVAVAWTASYVIELNCVAK